jgi:ribonuclease R
MTAKSGNDIAGPIAAQELSDIAVESSLAERRAADAERELMEWKKMRFMADKVGDDFKAIILSVTKYGFFVELDELFIEGMVPIGSLVGDHYSFRDTDRTICGARTGHCFRVGERVEVILDRVDRQQRRLQFALVPGTEPAAPGSSRKAPREEKRTKVKTKKRRK